MFGVTASELARVRTSQCVVYVDNVECVLTQALARGASTVHGRALQSTRKGLQARQLHGDSSALFMHLCLPCLDFSIVPALP